MSSLRHDLERLESYRLGSCHTLLGCCDPSCIIRIFSGRDTYYINSCSQNLGMLDESASLQDAAQTAASPQYPSQDITIDSCKRAVLAGQTLSVNDAADLFDLADDMVDDLARAAAEITRKMTIPGVDIEQLYNIKKNACSEDCTFCSQSAFYNTGIDSYQLPPSQDIIKQAGEAKRNGAVSYCLVAAWREPPPKDFERVCDIISELRNDVGIDVECSLGFLTLEQASELKRRGTKRYNHNLETARSKFPEICTTHTYQDRLDTLQIARNAGLELCTGGIIGMGETRKQRLELAQDIARIAPEEVTINILVPVPGTPLELQSPLEEAEIVRMIAVLRFMLPHSTIKVSGGREAILSDAGQSLLLGGANGIITEGYLTMNGNQTADDLAMIYDAGLQPRR